MKLGLGWEPSRGARYAEKWWKRNGYEYERVSCGAETDDYVVGKTGDVKVKFSIESRNTDFAGAMNSFQRMYEIKANMEKLHDKKNGEFPTEEIDG
jgi:hypothetical protein